MARARSGGEVAPAASGASLRISAESCSLHVGTLRGWVEDEGPRRSARESKEWPVDLGKRFDTRARAPRALATVALVTLAACSSAGVERSPDDSASWPVRTFDPKEPAEEGESARETKGASAPAADAGAPTSDAGAGGACTSTKTDIACFDCCAAAAPKLAVPAWNAAFEACLCATPGVCKAACGGSLCQGQAPSSGCDRCLVEVGGATCSQAADTACLGAPSCAPLVQCERAAGCAAKPTN